MVRGEEQEAGSFDRKMVEVKLHSLARAAEDGEKDVESLHLESNQSR